MRCCLRALAAAVALWACTTATAAVAATPAERFHEANELARAGDYPAAIALYDSLARSGRESAALDWNWAQAAAARGAQGEALWALLRARERDPADPAVAREIDRLREGANLDRAELSPDPLAAVARTGRQFHLDLVACALLLFSLAAHAILKTRGAPRIGPLVWTSLALGLAVALVSVAGALARPTGVIVRRGAPMIDAASPTADVVGTLREGEVVPVIEASGGYVRVEDSSGVRGWALAGDVRALVGPRRGQ